MHNLKTINKIWLVLLMMAAIVAAASCSKKEAEDGASNTEQRSDRLEKIQEASAHPAHDVVTSKDLNDLIEKSIYTYYRIEANQLQVEKNEDLDDEIFTLFTLDYKEKDYVGYLYSKHNQDHYDTLYIDIYPEDKTNPFSIVQAAGEFDELHRKYRMVLGSINDKSIKRMVVSYSDHTTNTIDLSNENKSYMDVTLGETQKADLVTAYNENNQKVFEYHFAE